MNDIEQITQELTWKLRQKELYPDLSIDVIKLPEDDLGTHLGLFYENKLATVVSLFQKEDHLQFRKLATDSKYQRLGLGSKMINYVIDYAREKQLQKVWCNARLSATGFYKKLGFTEIGEVFSKGGIDYVIMEITI
ncbi:GNAT family N-acetyltransferase [Pedobacter arcticus]|uniref:GNAT family N-acetyltransferase n=1 Tax=Pedobacter arcticus TaxID=752140 RepID=UPI0002DD82D2|nr:GNAT family N-acetyltransferase [Pedobacter arcticus]